MTFREIAFGSPEYGLECRLREEVLRRPLGLPLSEEDLAGEAVQMHFGLFEPDEDLVACVVAVPLSPTDARIRQMAVSAPHQRKGLGERMMGELEGKLKARGFRKLVLDARTSAVGFYEKLGYTVDGNEFVHVTIPHLRMVKTVSPTVAESNAIKIGGGPSNGSEGIMTFMIIERFRGGDAVPVYRRFRERGRMAPDGLRYVSSWVSADLKRCFQIMECDDRSLLDAWISRWEDLVDFEVVPVITSSEAQAAVAASR